MGRPRLTLQMRGAGDRARSVRRQVRLLRGIEADPNVLDRVHEPPIGAHFVTPRRGDTHHGITH